WSYLCWLCIAKDPNIFDKQPNLELFRHLSPIRTQYELGHRQSRPYSPSAFSACNLAMSAGQLHTAFEYISKHLAGSGIHVTLVVTGRALSVLRFGSTSTTHEVSVIQATPLDSRSLAVLSKLVQKAAIKFEFGVNWIHNSLESKYS